jgi:hypothetical protein
MMPSSFIKTHFKYHDTRFYMPKYIPGQEIEALTDLGKCLVTMHSESTCVSADYIFILGLFLRNEAAYFKVFNSH